MFAFKGCSSLEHIDIPNSIISIGYSAFQGCTSLESIDIPKNVKILDHLTFDGCTSLKSIDIPGNVTEIDDSVFNGCTSLMSIDIPNSVKKIGHSAFASCISLESIDIPNSVTEIGHYAFYGCISLESIYIPNNITTIDNSTFRNCTSLKSIYIPNSITEIGRSAFSGCISLESIDIPVSVIFIGSHAFQQTRIKVISIPSSVRYIEDHSLCNCPFSAIEVEKDNPVYFSHDKIIYKRIDEETCSLIKYPPRRPGASFIVNESTKKLESCAFKGANELSEIILHGNIVSLGDQHTFAGCLSLKRIELPKLITKIPYEAFVNCVSLEEVFLPNSEHYTIRNNVFGNCSSLKSIHSVAESPDGITIDDNAFDGFNIDECTLYIPSGTRWEYRHHPGFGKFKKIEIERKV